MKEYLKMSDVFPDGVCVGTDEWMNGWFEVRHAGGTSIDESCDGGYSERDANYVAHAINSHDELVAEVEKLRDALWRIYGDGVNFIGAEDLGDEEDEAEMQGKFNDTLIFVSDLLK